MSADRVRLEVTAIEKFISENYLSINLLLSFWWFSFFRLQVFSFLFPQRPLVSLSHMKWTFHRITCSLAPLDHAMKKKVWWWYFHSLDFDSAAPLSVAFSSFFSVIFSSTFWFSFFISFFVET